MAVYANRNMNGINVICLEYAAVTIHFYVKSNSIKDGFILCHAFINYFPYLLKIRSSKICVMNNA